MRFLRVAALAAVSAGWAVPAQAQDINILLPADEIEQQLTTEPFTITTAEISRPKAKGDITLKAEVSFSGNPPYRLKLRRAEPGDTLRHALQEFGRARMAAYKCPRKIEFVEALPKTPSGKVKRKELREREAAGE